MFTSKKPKTRLTADQARELTGPGVDQLIDKALENVEDHAKNGLFRCELRGDIWGDNGTMVWSKAFDELTKLGYRVTFSEMGDSDHFADPHTTISW